jgi:glycosyltransferase involved in cell wall biosynthesis
VIPNSRSAAGRASDVSIAGGSLRPGVVHVVTSDLALILMRGQLQYLQRRGFDVTVISSPGKWLDEAAQVENIRTVRVRMERAFAPLRDLVSLWRLWRNMRAICPTVTNVSTPKAGLLGGFAAWLSRVPCRFYTLRGLRFETAKGVRRQLLVYADRLACCFAHRVICVSQSLREKAIASGLTSREKTVVFGSGSSNGVDASRFELTPEMLSRAAQLRLQLDIPPMAPVVGFVGRLTRDKGVPELVEAFRRLAYRFPDLRLLLIGRFEDEDPLSIATRKFVQTHPRVICAGPVEDPAPYYALMDVLVLPTHREGFPNVVLEAQAAGKPVVAARATGVLDAIVDGETGLLFPVGEEVAIAEAVARLFSDVALAKKLACAGQKRVKHEFQQEHIWEMLCEEYFRSLKSKRLPLPSMRLTERTGKSGVAVQ